MAAKATAAKPVSTAEAFACPECGRTFVRAASLGAHRRRVHGIAGSSERAVTRRRRRGAEAAVVSPARGPATRPSARRRRRARADTSGVLNHDGLLEVLFPQGMPAREEVLRAVNAWLAEADRLARMR